jgi:inhibitor of cysteine peptidase
MRNIRLLAMLTILALWGCTPEVPVSPLFIEPTEENSVTVERTTKEPISKSVTLEATQSASSAEGSTPMGPEQSILELTESDSGKSIEIKLGTSIILHLNGQPSTGYTWIVDEVNSSILIQEGEPQYTASSNLRGAEEVMVWKFQSVGAGSTSLKLIYTRAFEKDQPPLKTFELAIEVGNR